MEINKLTEISNKLINNPTKECITNTHTIRITVYLDILKDVFKVLSTFWDDRFSAPNDEYMLLKCVHKIEVALFAGKKILKQLYEISELQVVKTFLSKIQILNSFIRVRNGIPFIHNISRENYQQFLTLYNEVYEAGCEVRKAKPYKYW